jgi:glycosyltransferase involved in cell wall biosynthesis
MKVLLLNNRYHVTGGPERYLFGIESELRARGHEVVPFALRYTKNEPTPHADGFPSPPGSGDAVYFRDVRGLRAKARFFARGTYYADARRRLERVIERERPDLAYVIILANGLSPSVLLACRDAGIPVVMRLSDFHLIAPCYLLFDGRETCERCLHGTRVHAVRKRCLQGSAVVSLARVIGMNIQERLGLYDAVDRFVAPSRFLRDKMIEAGTEASRIVHIPSFVESQGDAAGPPGEFLLYVGRIAPEKGVDRLLTAYRDAGSPGRLLIAGDTATAEGENVLRQAREQGLSNVRFVGRCSAEEVQSLMVAARAVVIPSVCYENLPLVALEAMAAGRAVIAHRLGSLPEVVDHGATGFLCDPANPIELSGAIRRVMADAALAGRLGEAGRARARSAFSSSRHVDALLDLWSELRRDRLAA